MEIRNYVKEDLNNGLIDVFIEGYKYHQKGRPDIFTVLTDEDLKKDFFNNLDKMQTLVALDDNKVIGYLSYVIKEKRVSKMNIEQLIVTEKYRGCGVGKKLMDEAERIAADENCVRIELNCWMFNQNALGMYKHIGFEEQRIMFEKKVSNKKIINK